MNNDPDASARFLHKPLDDAERQVRLVRLLPKSKDGVIRCSLRHANLGSKYVAVSYVWGPPTPTRDILIDGKSFTLRENLWRFLARQCERDRSRRYYWIDQICINQQDTPEKNSQVSRMGTIYAKAKKVFTWLGSDDDGPTLLRAISGVKLGPLSLAVDRQGKLPGQRFAVRTSSKLHGAASRYLRRCLLANCGGSDLELSRRFHRVAYNDYWHRAWTSPEFILARDSKIIVGTDEISLVKFVRAYYAMPTTKHEPPMSAFIHAKVRKQLEGPSKRSSSGLRRERLDLHELIQFFADKHLFCEKRVDIIYSLLGLLEGNCLLKPDYSRDRETLYRDAFICEWDLVSFHAEDFANLLAKSLWLDPMQVWKNLLSHLGLEHAYSGRNLPRVQIGVYEHEIEHSEEELGNEVLREEGFEEGLRKAVLRERASIVSRYEAKNVTGIGPRNKMPQRGP